MPEYCRRHFDLNKLKDVAKALDMQFVYGFIPNAGSLSAMIENKAREIAREIVIRTDQNMALEDQSNSSERINKAIEERAEQIKNEMPKILWE